MRHKQKMLILIVIAAACIGLFLFYGLPSVWEYALPRRFAKVFAIIVVGTAIAYSSMIFQTITNNRILTPSILGLDSLYVLLQTGIIYFFGAAKLADLGKNGNFFIVNRFDGLFFICVVFPDVSPRGKAHLLAAVSWNRMRHIVQKPVILYANADRSERVSSCSKQDVCQLQQFEHGHFNACFAHHSGDSRLRLAV